LGAAEGISYLVVGSIVLWSLTRKITTGSGELLEEQPAARSQQQTLCTARGICVWAPMFRCPHVSMLRYA